MNYAHAISSKGVETDRVILAQKGDLESFNHLVLAYQDRIFSLAFHILGDADLADDIAQNTFLAAYHNLPQFRNGSFQSWLFRIATNACYDELRRQKRHPALSLDAEEQEEERLILPNEFPGVSISPEKAYEKLEIEQSIQKALNQLVAEQRAVVVLVDLQGHNYQEAAEVLGIPVGTVKSRIARGRMQLSHLLKDYLDIDRFANVE